MDIKAIIEKYKNKEISVEENTKNILEKIKSDAKAQADSIIEEAEKKAQRIIDEAIETEKDSAALNTIKTKREAEALVEKTLTSAELKARDLKLSASQEIINKVLERVKDKLKNLDKDSYIKYLKRNLKDFQGKDIEIMVQKDKLDQVKALDLPFKISDRTVESGFAFVENDLIYNGDFSSLVEFMREDLEGQIASQLSQR